MNSFRLSMRRGGSFALRWSVRLVLLGLVVACGFIPWKYEIGGPFHLAPGKETGVRAQIADEIVRIHVKEGDLVQPGQIVAELAAREELAGLARAKAQLKQAKARLRLLHSGARDEDRAMAMQRVELWKIQLAFFESEFARKQALVQLDAAGVADFEKTKQSRDSAQSALLSAEEALKRVELGPREEEIEAQAAEVERYEAEVAHFENQVDLKQVTAPIGGRVVTKDVDLRTGHAVQPGDLLAVIHDSGVLRAEIAASESAAVQVRVGMPVKLRLNGADGELLTGKVVHVAHKTIEQNQFDQEAFRSDRETRVEEVLNNEEEIRVRVDVELDPTDVSLVPGMTGQAKIVVQDDRLWRAVWRPVLRFFRVDVWSWLP